MDGTVETLLVTDGAGERLDVFIAGRLPDMSRARIQRLVDEGLVLVAGEARKSNYKVRAGDTITVRIPPPRPTDILPEEIPLEVVYEDADLVVVNKPKGMTTHPAPGSPAGTLVNAVLARCKDLSGVGGVERPGIVHRLDKNTSGLIVIAKNDRTHVSLQRQIQARTAVREYVALVWGDAPFEKAVVDAPIGRHPVDRKRMAVIREARPGAPAARPAVTELRVLRRLRWMTLIEARLLTGRTHQIRVHCSFAGHPVVGDPVYAAPKHPLPQRFTKAEQAELQNLVTALKGQALHAARLSFDHPTTGERMEFETQPPKEMTDVVEWAEAHTE